MVEEVNWKITQEERIRHDALFYSQKPRDGFLSGERARALFIRSKLPLPELSKIWKLADVTRDSMLDTAEFAIAVHLIQSRLKGLEIPSSLPHTLSLQHLPLVKVPQMTMSEWEAYQNTFSWKDEHNAGYLDTQTACSLLLSSQLPSDVLSIIWDLSDLDRDLQLSLTEFAIAIHLVRFCKTGNRLDGSVDVMSLLPGEIPAEDPDAKRQRLAEVQIAKRRLLSIKEKLCLEIAGALDDHCIAEQIRPELDKVEIELQSLEKEENGLRKDLRYLQDKTKKGVFNPFDRSFLLKRRRSGKDLFKEKPLIANQVEDNELNELFTVGGPQEIQHRLPNKSDKFEQKTSLLDENLTATKDHAVNNERVITSSQDSFEQKNENGNETKSEKSTTGVNFQINKLVDSNCAEGEEIPLNQKLSEEEMQAGVTRTVDFNQKQEVESVQQEYLQNVDTGRQTYSSSSSSVKPNAATDQHLSLQNCNGNLHNGVVNDEAIAQTGKADVSSSKDYEMLKRIDNGVEGIKDSVKNDNSSCNNDSHEHSDDNMQAGERLAVSKATEIVDYSGSKHNDCLEKRVTNVVETNSGSLQMKDESRIASTNTNMNSAPIKHETKMNSDKFVTQRGLFPRPISVVEDKKRDEEERLRKRKIEEALVRKARQDQQKREEDQKNDILDRKASFEKERQKLLSQMSLANQESEVKRMQFSKSKAGKNQQLIEKQMQQGKEQIKEEEKRECHKTEKNGHHVDPQAHNSDTKRPQQFGTRTSIEKRKSVIDLEIERQKAAEEELRKETERRKLEQFQSQSPTISRGEKIDISSSSSVEAPSENTLASRDVVDSKCMLSSVKQESEDDKSLNKILEEERKKEKEEQEKVRKDYQLREAAELVRQKLKREKELRRKKEAELAEAEKCRREEQEREKERVHEAKLRRTVFEAQKKFLEERMRKDMEENEVQRFHHRRTSSSSSTASSERSDTLEESRKLPIRPIKHDKEDLDEQPATTGVRDRMVAFQRNETKGSKWKPGNSSTGVDEKNSDSDWKPQDVTMRNKPSNRDSKNNRASFYAENLRAIEIKKKIEVDTEGKPKTDEDLYTKRKMCFGNISGRRKQFEQNLSQNQSDAAVKVNYSPSTSPRDEVDSGQISTFQDERIRRELEDQKRKEASWRKPAELAGKKAEGPPPTEKMENIKRNPLPNKMQVTKPESKSSSSERSSSPVEQNKPKKKVGKSLLEIEREEERRREEELALAREEARKAMMTKEQKLQEERRRKQEEEAEQARKAQEEKDKRKRRTSAMAAMWEKMAQQ